MNEALLDAARKTVPTLAANAARTERELMPAPDSVAAVRAAGLFALTVPRAAGGQEADLRTLVEVLAALGRGCPSTAWVVGLNASNKGVARLMLSAEGQDAVLADPDAVCCASNVMSRQSSGVRVPGGLRVSGRWAMASGSELASLAMVGVPLPDGETPAVAMALVPVSDLSVERTWRAAGLAGTSSHTLVAEDVFVPDGFVNVPGAAGPARSIPPESMFTGGLAALAPMIGATRGARDLVAAAVAGGRAPYLTTYARVADSPLGRYWFTEAMRRTDTAMRRTVRVADVLDELPVGGRLPVAERVELRVELSTAARECREAMELLLDLHGASGFADDNPLQRFWRDVAVGTRHPFFTPYILAEDEGRLAFDVQPTVSLAL
ncbi:acyl-CoA dehydrogenase family protein [Catenuloplanes atrovinosus]|uniref:Alkylation response protein AidB-like acyl-CoA dehydrogenase n=1 Tax=Catenuloplanes atrovinosus TaxID=137266 RepID=A0AAE3YPY6_9ACTN|nr:acyl-CoA dehydrogenase family protein [Catenuloplanes atrovinosus]MDR7277117.1 alkylation response protein AidB-like acyl-CoA dehydrogenase [Catenuloplanes atrovinosus]